tara:strand:+ start:143 stop:1306 length:1164 start_codon:yes stop_codon:yes gene_type:complete
MITYYSIWMRVNRITKGSLTKGAVLKKLGTFFTILIVSFGVVACGSDGTSGKTDVPDQTDADAGPPPQPDVKDTTETTEPDVPEDTSSGFTTPCEDNSDCPSGFCVPSSEGKVCTEACIDDCPDGWQCQQVNVPGQDPVFLCLSQTVNLCSPCTVHQECRELGGNIKDRCVNFGEQEGSFCATDCSDDKPCPEGYACNTITDDETGQTYQQCLPDSGECACSPWAIESAAQTTCGSTFCEGTRVCAEEGLTDCNSPAPTDEVCDGNDNDCDGLADEDLGTTSCGVGACAKTVDNCSNGVAQSCDPLAGASEESCDDIDNDCDGYVDETCALKVEGWIFGDGFVLGADNGEHILSTLNSGVRFVGESTDGELILRFGLPNPQQAAPPE